MTATFDGLPVAGTVARPSMFGALFGRRAFRVDGKADKCVRLFGALADAKPGAVVLMVGTKGVKAAEAIASAVANRAAEAEGAGDDFACVLPIGWSGDPRDGFDEVEAFQDLRRCVMLAADRYDLVVLVAPDDRAPLAGPAAEELADAVVLIMPARGGGKRLSAAAEALVAASSRPAAALLVG